MKKRVNFISQALAVVIFTLLIVKDFFPDLGINMSLVGIGIVISIVLAIITRQKGEPVFHSSKQDLIFSVFSGIYFFSLLIILNFLGGESQVGIGLTNPILWGLYLIGVLASYYKYKKELNQSSTNEKGTLQ